MLNRINLPLKQIVRFRRIQHRKPLTYYESFAKAAEAQAKKKPALILKPSNDQIKNDLVKKQNQQSNLLDLQREAQNIFEKHDPFYEHDTPFAGAIEEIMESVEIQTSKQNINIEQLPDGDQRFGPIIQSAKSLRHRYEKNRILLEGKLLIKDALDAGVKLEYIYLVKNSNLNDYKIDLAKLNFEPTIYKVSMKAMSLWSDVDTPQGIMAIAKMPLKGECKFKRSKALPITLILDQIKDPGNMGTIIRTACAFGVDRILTSKGCVDIWDPKVIRSSMGAHFRIPIIHALNYDEIPGYVPQTSTVLFADALGSNKHSKEESIKCIDLNRLSKINNKFQHVTLVVGNETQGISNRLTGSLGTKDTKAIVNIQLNNGIDSLNASIACSILCYEIRNLLDI